MPIHVWLVGASWPLLATLTVAGVVIGIGIGALREPLGSAVWRWAAAGGVIGAGLIVGALVVALGIGAPFVPAGARDASVTVGGHHVGIADPALTEIVGEFDRLPLARLSTNGCAGHGTPGETVVVRYLGRADFVLRLNACRDWIAPGRRPRSDSLDPARAAVVLSESM